MVCLFIPALLKRLSEPLMGEFDQLAFHIHHHNVKDHILISHISLPTSGQDPLPVIVYRL